MIGIGVIGYGYWGPNLVRNFNNFSHSYVVAVCDLLPERLSKVQTLYPKVYVTRNHREIVAHPRIDAIAIATPVASHFDLAIEALRAGKHVLVEKPLAATSEQALRLIEEAARRNRVLMVDHTFVYTGAVRKIKELISTGELGQIFYYDSVRINLGLFQHDVNVLWDLAVHDVAILDYVLSARACALSATGISHLPGEPENVAYVTLFFEDSLIAHINVNWLAPVKVRRTLIGGSKKMIVYDDLDPSEKVKIYDKGISVDNSSESVYQMLISYRTGDMWAPRLDMTEALKIEALHFVRCVEGIERPITDGEAGLRVVQVLEAASKSMAESGRPVEL